MGRRAGSHNADFEATRVGLLIRVGARLLAPDGASASLQKLATAAGVGVTTLKHYFPDRDALIAAYLKHCHDQGRESEPRAKRKNSVFHRLSPRTDTCESHRGERGGRREPILACTHRFVRPATGRIVTWIAAVD